MNVRPLRGRPDTQAAGSVRRRASRLFKQEDRTLAGLYFEDFEEGTCYDTVPRTITEADVMAFAGTSGDFNRLHTDRTFAAETAFKEPIAHGLLVLSVVTGLKQRLGIFEGTVIAFLGLTWNFKAPVFFGDTIWARIHIEKMKETSKPDRGITYQKVEVFNQDGTLVQDGEHVLMMKRRNADQAEG